MLLLYWVENHKQSYVYDWLKHVDCGLFPLRYFTQLQDSMMAVLSIFVLSKIEEQSETLRVVTCLLLPFLREEVLRQRQVVFEPGVSPPRRTQLCKQLSVVLILRLQRIKEPPEVLASIIWCTVLQPRYAAGNGGVGFPWFAFNKNGKFLDAEGDFPYIFWGKIILCQERIYLYWGIEVE